jgi:hypothetical protein
MKMASVNENLSELRAVVKFLQAEGFIQSVINRNSVSVYYHKVFSREQVPVRYKKFKDGRTVLNNDPKNTEADQVF